MQDNRYLETGLDIRTENLMVRLTPAEKQRIASEAQKLGISISAFVRLLLSNWVNGVVFQKRS